MKTSFEAGPWISVQSAPSICHPSGRSGLQFFGKLSLSVRLQRVYRYLFHTAVFATSTMIDLVRKKEFAWPVPNKIWQDEGRERFGQMVV